ncbi:alpha/beta fold hydrolase [Paenibacillus tarimensis]|uniref:alpha/beta fold hydrolase n=1 Tax=Paenibacillus tarimensis TaxID=416012 RepID=UPI001F373F6D|nr:alpha/beta hydrolase [Paenibacillus tarimensis]MCF2943285.1 alpha/beta hydrolase [Paenibacillus tarimensis]
MIIHANGIAHYVEATGGGPTLLFIHPPLLPGAIFNPQREGLTDRFRVVIPDLRGHGRSSPSSSEWNFTHVIDDLRQILDQLNVDKVWLCGYSAGGSAAYEMAFTFPDKVKGLIQIGAVPGIDAKDTALQRLVRSALSMTRPGCKELLSLLGTMVNTKQKRNFWPLLQASRQSNGFDAACYYRAYYHYNCLDRLEQLQKPILLVYGEKDRLFGKYAEIMSARLPDCSTAWISKARHELPCNRPEELNELIRQFLSHHE